VTRVTLPDRSEARTREIPGGSRLRRAGY
jgi:hypothetical protein